MARTPSHEQRDIRTGQYTTSMDSTGSALMHERIGKIHDPESTEYAGTVRLTTRFIYTGDTCDWEPHPPAEVEVYAPSAVALAQGAAYDADLAAAAELDRYTDEQAAAWEAEYGAETMDGDWDVAA